MTQQQVELATLKAGSGAAGYWRMALWAVASGRYNHDSVEPWLDDYGGGLNDTQATIPV